MIRDGVTIILVSHDIHLIQRLCNKAIWLEHGIIKDVGSSEKICKQYSAV